MATYQGLLNAGNSGLAPLLAGLLGGAIFDATGPQAVFVVSAGAVAIGVVVLLVTQMLGWFSDHRSKPEEHLPSTEHLRTNLSNNTFRLLFSLGNPVYSYQPGN